MNFGALFLLISDLKGGWSKSFAAFCVATRICLREEWFVLLGQDCEQHELVSLIKSLIIRNNISRTSSIDLGYRLSLS
jgi:hypothetical protein